MKLLLIDDQINILLSLKEALEPGGHACRLFDQPKEALACFEKESFDAVVTDLKMPKIDGIEVLKRIQKLRPGTPVIILTGYADTDNAIQAVNHGAYAFYQKPIKIKKFIETLTTLEQRIALRRQREMALNHHNEDHAALVSEVSHRIKDNLQLIISLLRIQMRSSGNRETADALMEANSRIRSMALIHDYINVEASPVCVRMHEYIPMLAHELRQALVDDRAIELDFHFGALCVPLEQAIPLGMIINELVVNAMKHAFSACGGPQPKIVIGLEQTRDQRFRLRVQDNGRGLNPDFDFGSAETVGLSIVRILAEDQLQGEVKIIRRRGTTFEILLHASNEVAV